MESRNIFYNKNIFCVDKRERRNIIQSPLFSPMSITNLENPEKPTHKVDYTFGMVTPL